MERRVFGILLTGGVVGMLAASGRARAQEPSVTRRERVGRIGVLMAGAPPATASDYESFRRGLGDLGQVDGRTVRLLPRWDDGRAERWPYLMAGLLRATVDVLVASQTSVALAARRARPVGPMVLIGAPSPESPDLDVLATGQGPSSADIVGAGIDLLKELVPGLRRTTVVAPPGRAGVWTDAAAATARSRGLDVSVLEALDGAALDAVLDRAAQGGSQAFLFPPSSFFTTQRARVIARMMDLGVPVLSADKSFVEAGGLLQYSAEESPEWRRAAELVDALLRGVSPPSTWARLEPSVNVRTARTLGLTVPGSLLSRAQRVID